jgi:hypothetical protein
MTREEFIKQRCEIDKITEEEFEKRYRVVKCNCGQPYCKGYRCLDLDGLLKENKELKKQLEEINKMIEKCGFVNIEQVMLSYCGLIAQQKEFINYLEDEIHSCEAVSDLLFNSNKEMKVYKEILQKYRKIIGDDK